MIYITGDCHGSFKRFTKKYRDKYLSYMNKDDYLIVCGDFSLCRADDKEFEYNCKWLSSLPFVILFVDGNHENFTILNKYPVDMWHGGKVHHIVRNKIIHLMRGQVFTIEGKTFFTMGGASSSDISGGILDKKDSLYSEKRKQAVRLELPYRVVGESFWYEELPSPDELGEGCKNLAGVGYNVDYIISHCFSSKMQDKLSDFSTHTYKTDILTDYFNQVEKTVYYKHWFCGHYHIDLDLDDKHTIVYKNVVLLEESREK